MQSSGAFSYRPSSQGVHVCELPAAPFVAAGRHLAVSRTYRPSSELVRLPPVPVHFSEYDRMLELAECLPWFVLRQFTSRTPWSDDVCHSVYAGAHAP